MRLWKAVWPPAGRALCPRAAEDSGALPGAVQAIWKELRVGYE